MTTKVPVAPVATKPLVTQARTKPPAAAAAREPVPGAPGGTLRIPFDPSLLAAPRGTPATGVPTAIAARIPIAPHGLAAITAGERAAVTTRLSRSGIDEALRAMAALPAAGDLSSAPRRFRDDRLGAWVVSVLPGEVYVSDQDEYITTVLGSCVSTCVRHPGTGAGGMNHLVLPDTQRTVRVLSCDGLTSLDRLIAGVLSYGGRAEELEIKIFGGGRVIAGNGDVGRINVAAVRDYFASRGLAIAISDVGGGVARRLRYEPRTGRVLIQRTVMRETSSPSSS